MARYDLEPLDQAETGAYIQHRLQVAGLPASVELFPPAVVRRTTMVCPVAQASLANPGS